MGNWISSAVINLDSFLHAATGISFKRSTRTRYRITDSNTSSTSILLSAAAKIASHQIMEKKRQTTMSSYDYDTDMEDVMRSDDDDEFSSDDDCPRMNAEEEAKMFERERQIAFRGRLTIGDEKSLYSMREDISMRCGCSPSTSVPTLAPSRELGGKRRGLAKEGLRTAVINEFMPNSRKVVQKVQSKTFCCQYVMDGQQLVVASQDEKIRFYEKNSGRGRHSSRYVMFNEIQVQVCSWSILDLAVNRFGDALCYGTWKDAVYYAKLSEPSSENSTGVTWHQFEIPENEHNMAVFSCRFNKAADQIVCGSSDYCIHVFDVETRTKTLTVNNAHEDDVNVVCYGDDSSHLIYSAADDGLIKVWDRRAWSEGDMQPVGVFAGHRDGITYVDSRGDDRYLISNCKDQTIKLWDLRKFSSEEGINETRKCVHSQAWDYRWQPAPPGLCQPVRGDTSVLTLRGHNVLHTLVRAKFSPERTGKRYIYTGCARGEVVVYDVLTGVVSHRLKGHNAVVRDVDWNPEENEMAACSWDGVTSVWSYDERRARPTAPHDGARLGDEDSCDEFYKPIFKKPRRARQSTSHCTSTRMECEDSDQE